MYYLQSGVEVLSVSKPCGGTFLRSAGGPVLLSSPSYVLT